MAVKILVTLVLRGLTNAGGVVAGQVRLGAKAKPGTPEHLSYPHLSQASIAGQRKTLGEVHPASRSAGRSTSRLAGL